MIPHHYTLFQDPHSNYPIHDNHLPFADYIAQCQQIIRQTRVDLTENPQADHIVEANSPFEWLPDTPIPSPVSHKKSRYGALLMHGLFDCPFMMQDVGRQLQSQGLITRAILLPGHGTVPGGLLHVTYEDWVQAMHYGIASLADAVDHIFLVGFSTGATLALYQALEKSAPIAGLILIAPAIQIRSAFSKIAGWPRPLNRWWERSQWFTKATENDYTKYQSIPFNAVYQLERLIQALHQRQQTHTLTCPVLIAASQADQTVSTTATLRYFKQYTSADSQFILYTDQAKTHIDKHIIRRPATYPAWDSHSMSHVSIPIAPDNRHYGKQGDYLRVDAMTASTARRGWHKALDSRLTFNPDFDFLKASIAGFINAHIKGV